MSINDNIVIILIGHSFIRRLFFIQTVLREDWHGIHFVGISGGQIPHIVNAAGRLPRHDVCIMQIGGNDITASTVPASLTMSILNTPVHSRDRYSCEVKIEVPALPAAWNVSSCI